MSYPKNDHTIKAENLNPKSENFEKKIRKTKKAQMLVKTLGLFGMTSTPH